MGRNFSFILTSNLIPVNCSSQHITYLQIKFLFVLNTFLFHPSVSQHIIDNVIKNLGVQQLFQSHYLVLGD